jgi:5-methylcytosine-specific restriction enzyme subunit McrC
MKADKRISVFEYDILRPGEHNGVVFSKEHLEVLSHYGNEKRVPWFELVHNGIRFTSFVGALQVKDLLIEVLPKIDKAKEDVDLWHHVLVSMLRDVGMLQVIETGTSTLRLKSNSLLELYFGRFVTECEKLVHKGLVRRYRKHQGNLNALKGAIHFGRHITENLVHQERFYTRHNVYDYNHVFNSLLFQALIVIRRLTNTPQLHSRIQCLLLCFPETDILNPTERLFGTLPFSRSTPNITACNGDSAHDSAELSSRHPQRQQPRAGADV